MNYAFHPDAEAEFLNAVDYYESCEVGLGNDFSIEIYKAIQNIMRHPHSWSLMDAEVRRCIACRFPYGILYAAGSNEIRILAVMHLRREPDYWKTRT